MSVILGADPELFLEDQVGKVISVIGKIGGTKDKPLPIKSLGKGFAIQEDNVLLEYNIPPSKSVLAWKDNHLAMLTYLAEKVGALGLKLSNKASHSMDADQLDHPMAWVFGCEPDFDAWGLKWNSKPESIDPNFRTAGGHVHISYDNPNPATSIKIARLCDLLIGAPLQEKDPDKLRAKFYGRPAAIRFKPYGLEYRTPSNYWLQSPDNVVAVFEAARGAVAMLPQYDKYAERARLARDYIAGEATEYQNIGWNEYA